jgi:isopenicillin N synthase-like dioxygenase
MSMTQMPDISLRQGSPQEIAQKLGESFKNYGFAKVVDHGLDPDMVKQAWALSKALFDLPVDTKMRWYDKALAGQRGYTPFKTEIAKGADHHDLKEFWHVGRSVLAPNMLPNVWPDAVPGFRETFEPLYTEFDRIGAQILSYIALYLELPANWFAPSIDVGNSILRLLHYPPIAGDADGCIRAGAHEDINLITLLLGAEEAGLQILRPNGSWMDVSPPQGGIAVNIGDMLQRLCNHMLPSTTHRVVNPSGERAQQSRYSMPFFLHLNNDFLIRTLPGYVSADNPDRYPQAILADDYLRERLIEIGLLKV